MFFIGLDWVTGKNLKFNNILEGILCRKNCIILL